MKIGFLHALALIFITLKLTNYIAWSWFWVVSPIVIPLIISLLIIFIAAIISPASTKEALSRYKVKR